jgi:hypothetical protein
LLFDRRTQFRDRRRTVGTRAQRHSLPRERERVRPTEILVVSALRKRGTMIRRMTRRIYPRVRFFPTPRGWEFRSGATTLWISWAYSRLTFGTTTTCPPKMIYHGNRENGFGFVRHRRQVTAGKGR